MHNPPARLTISNKFGGIELSENEVLSVESATSQENGTILSDRCMACHRHLKDPMSMKRGLGPVCFKRNEEEIARAAEDAGSA